ncbi:Zn-dependent hydrolase of the beta-lactamase fold-like protein [Candidatus Saccharibacteria bacterium RAAC3_TM7_1]|nr:Zn-dependent hydrolase of the beta-lactamase fold-like protein [Candidatus Saccharibacteria bacterium RAAC3_TM7_1]HCZ28141.1 MBL fold hydrolase [Candidatus Saccharibacteria bacterium]
MFELEYKGGNTMVISTRKSKLITDPKQSVVGLKDIEPKGMVSVATEARFTVHSDDALLEVEGPGEYEVGDFSIRGIAAQRHLDDGGALATIYRIEVGDVRIALLGNIDPQLSEDQLEALGVVDMIILPVGGSGYTLDATSAAQLVRRIDAKAVIPVHYADKAVKYEVPQDAVEVFIKEFPAAVESMDKLKVKSAASLPTVATIYKLTRS